MLLPVCYTSGSGETGWSLDNEICNKIDDLG